MQPPMALWRGHLAFESGGAPLDPISLIVGALTMGASAAAKDVGGRAVREAYDGLKRLIADRYKRSGAIAAVEEDPSSEAQKRALQEALGKTDIALDVEVVQSAKNLALALETVPQPDLATIGLQIDHLRAMSASFGDIDISGSGKGAILRDVALGGELKVGNIKVQNPN
jgi:hypothetical protein